MRRCLSFLRSVLPGDLAQLGVLLAALFLFVAPDLRWAPWGFRAAAQAVQGPRALAALGFFAIRISGCFGYLVCLRPGPHPLRRLLWWVCLPAVLGLVFMCGFYVHAAGSAPFRWVAIGLRSHAHSRLAILPRLGPGFHYALIGLVLVVAFTAKVALGSSSLPPALPQSSVSPLDPQASWHRMESFLWILLALLPTVFWVFPFMSFIFHFVQAQIRISALRVAAGFAAASSAMDSVVVVLAIFTTGKEAWRALRRSLRWPGLAGLALAVVFPLGIMALASAPRLPPALWHWAAYRRVGIAPPRLGPHSIIAALVLFLPIGFFEEWIFRGVLQPRFIRRFGVPRGIFLVGIIFGAWHLSRDFTTGFAGWMVAAMLVRRLVSSVALSFVWGWLTLRTDSVLPAALAHGLGDALASSPLGSAFPWIGPLTDLLWVALACMLFRYWPPAAEGDPEERRAAAIPVPVR